MLDWRNHIHSDPKVLLGKPTIKGTRLSIELILELFAAGWSNEMLLQSYPNLKKDDLTAVYLYLKECIEHELYFPISKSA
jgi:uncharacterized protein (DUF433 family)